MKYKEELSERKITIVLWIRKRIGNIYILYIVSDFIMLCFKVKENGIYVVTLKKIILDLLLMRTGWINGNYDTPFNGPSWFIGVLLLCEVIYYLVCVYSNQDNNKYIVLIAFLIILGIYLGSEYYELPFLYRTSGKAYTSFFAGCILCESKNYIEGKRKISSGIGILGITIIIATYLWSPDIWGDENVVICLINVMILMISFNIPLIGRLLSSNLLVMLGACSMYIFLFHMPLLKIYMFFFSKVESKLPIHIEYLIVIIFEVVMSVVIRQIDINIKRRCKRGEYTQ